MSKTPAEYWASHPPEPVSRELRRPRLLLLADAALVLLLVALAQWLTGSLVEPGFLADPDRVPPFVIEAGLDRSRAAALFGLPLALVAVTSFRLWFPSRATWPWTPLIVAWLALAAAEGLVANPDFAAGVLACGSVPAVVIGTHQPYLRRASGHSHLDRPWSALRRALTLVAAAAVTVFVAAYFFGAVIQMMDAYDLEGLPRFPVGP